MRIYRLNVERTGSRTRVQWLGPVRTYSLLLWARVKERDNW